MKGPNEIPVPVNSSQTKIINKGELIPFVIDQCIQNHYWRMMWSKSSLDDDEGLVDRKIVGYTWHCMNFKTQIWYLLAAIGEEWNIWIISSIFMQNSLIANVLDYEPLTRSLFFAPFYQVRMTSYHHQFSQRWTNPASGSDRIFGRRLTFK